MAPAFFPGTRSKRELRVGLAILALALALPAALLVRQAYSQLKWEAFHQHRMLAEALTQDIDRELRRLIAEAEALSFADYAFLVVEGDAQNNFLQRSPLSAFPVDSDLPGVLGYFQVDGDGTLSTPLLPRRDTSPAALGIPAREFEQRRALAGRIVSVLRDNRLVAGASDTALPAPDPASGGPAARAAAEAAPPNAARARAEPGGQAAFDALSGSRDANAAAGTLGNRRETAASLGKVADLGLETPYAAKLEESLADRAADRAADQAAVSAAVAGRASRKEQVLLPESPAVSREELEAARFYRTDVQTDTFESEIDPLEFSLLDSGHFVLFRKVWRNRERFIQGMLIEREPFLQEAVDVAFADSVTAGTSDLLVAYDDDVIYSGSASPRYGNGLQSPAPLLFRTRLSSPLDRLELIFRVRQLPPGPGAAVLGWVTLAFAAVLSIGFAGLYRLGAGQIDLARQQQDFVAAVSHELKTPLTSIRMYGEMLREGWADPQKRQQYYEYIHDESERLTRLIANVLQLARMSRNRPHLEIRPREVGALMEGIEAKIANQALLAGFELRVERDPAAETACVAVDEDAFAQIVINLIDNAVKFSHRAPERTIRLSSSAHSDGRIRFAVRDYGPGVPKDQMRKIFRLFYRSGNELTRETVGTGIGLAIVRELARAMDGTVDVVNRDPGAEFILSMPRHDG